MVNVPPIIIRKVLGKTSENIILKVTEKIMQ